MSEKLRIRGYNNGPLRIENLSEINYHGKILEVEEGEPVFFCRCGQSKNQPFCDATHHDLDFHTDSLLEEKKEEKIWEGSKLRTRFDPNLCMHVFYCKSLKELRAKEAEDLTAETAKEIMQIVESCPSGALQYEIKDESLRSLVKSPAANTVEVVKGGELRIQGNIETEFDLKAGQTRLTLCRCGQSKNKPFCDGRHRGLKNYQ